MRKVLIVGICTVLGSCLSETNVDPGSSATFIRYYNGGNNDEAKALAIAPDGGFVIIATTRIQKEEAHIPQFKIKLIKTDKNGNPMWQKLFPDVSVTDKNYHASEIQNIPSGGYVIAGEDIQSDGTAKSLLIAVDAEGNVVPNGNKSHNFGAGKAVAVTSTGNYLLLTTGTANMYLLEIDKTTFDPITTTAYPAGQTTIANKLIIDEGGRAVWSGKVENSGLKGIRVLKTLPSNVNTEFDRLISQPGFDLVGADICRYGHNYAVIGSTNRKPGATIKAADTDILFVRMTAFGDTLSTKSFPLDTPTIPDNQNDVGNAISSTNDGGLILLSSVLSAAISGRGDSDFYLIKIDAFGNKVWTSSFGSKFKDDGVAVRQTEDGGFVVLGTTTQGSLKILTLLKADKDGKIE